jgi:RimJ/RimL family protein N-acetyltransferase
MLCGRRNKIMDINLDSIETHANSSLDTYQLDKLKELITQAEQDNFLGNGQGSGINVKDIIVCILYEDKLIGFYSPVKRWYIDRNYFRAGALYLLPTYRGKGIMEKVLTDYFNWHKPGLAWIDESNTKSIALFKKLGFEQGKAWAGKHDRKGHWYTKINTTALEQIKTTKLRPNFLDW